LMALKALLLKTFTNCLNWRRPFQKITLTNKLNSNYSYFATSPK
jgi:hypothetical protein